MSDQRDFTLDEVKDGLASRSILLVDVREPHEFALAHIPGAVNVPLSTFDPGADRAAARPGRGVQLPLGRAHLEGDRGLARVGLPL